MRERLDDVQRLLASLTAEQIAELDRVEKSGTDTAQKKIMASGALSSVRPPTREGEEALRYAVEQIGKPYEWGAEGPKTFDCSGLTSQAWERACSVHPAHQPGPVGRASESPAGQAASR